jgi:hypothetical protein
MQHAGARDEEGKPVTVDVNNNQLTVRSQILMSRSTLVCTRSIYIIGYTEYNCQIKYLKSDNPVMTHDNAAEILVTTHYLLSLEVSTETLVIIALQWLLFILHHSAAF